MEVVLILQRVSDSCCSPALAFPWTHTQKYTDWLSLNSGSRSRTQTWELRCPVGLGRVLVDRVFCAWCHGEAVREGGGALGHAVLVWQWQGKGAEAALPWAGRACECRGNPGTTWAVHGSGLRGGG